MARRPATRDEFVESVSSGYKPQLRAYAPDELYPPVPTSVLKSQLVSRPSAVNVFRQRFGRAISLDRIEVALRAAQMGSMRMLTDLSRETIDTDPHLGSVLNKRFGAVSSLPWEVQPAAGHGVDKDKALFYASVVREQLLNLPSFRQTLLQLAWAMFDGRAALEIMWRNIMGPQHPKYGRVVLAANGIGWIHPRRLNFGPMRELRVVDEKMGISGGFLTTGLSLDPDDLKDNGLWRKFLQWTPQLFGEYPEREGLAPRCLYWSFFKRYSQRDRMILLELFGKPWRIAEVEEESSASGEELDAADEAVDGLGASYSARLPRGVKLNVVQPGRTAGQVHQAVVEESDRQISKLVLGQTGTTDGVPAGLNSSQANVMQDEQLMILTRDGAGLSEVTETQLCDAIIELNFGRSELPHAPRFVLRSDLPADRTVELDRLDKALRSGMEISRAEAYEVSGFRVPERDEPIIRMDQPPTPPMAPVSPPPRPVIVWPPGISPAAGEQQPSAPIASDGEGAREGAAAVGVGSADQGAIVTVNESRAAQGLPPLTLPDGQPDPDGDLTVEEFKARKAGKNGGGEPPAAPQAPEEGGGVEPSVSALPAVQGALMPADVHSPGELAVVEVEATIRHEGGKWVIYSEDGTKKLGEFDTKEEAEERLREIERIKHAAEQELRTEADRSQVGPMVIKLVRSEYEFQAELARFAPHGPGHECPLCLAKQPESVNGSPEEILERGGRELQRTVNSWANAFTDALEGVDNALAAFNALNRTAERLDQQPFARVMERRTVHGAALGALDSAYEAAEDEVIEQPALTPASELSRVSLQVEPEPGFAKKKFADAVKFFKDKNVVTRAAFDRMSAALKQRAFTVAGSTSQQMLRSIQGELAKQIGAGADIRQFRKFVKERLVSDGFVGVGRQPGAYVDNVFRTNVLGSYNGGRHAQMSQPEVVRVRPMWQIRTVKDDRRRVNHGRAHNLVLRANDPFWQTAYPPFGFNCRCRVISRTSVWATKGGVAITSGSTINYLPDPGFTSGIPSLIG